MDVDDAALSLVRFDNGAVGYLEGTRFATGRKNYNRFEINGAKGSIVWDLEQLNELQLYIEEGPTSGFRTISVTDGKHPYVGAWWPPGHIIGYEHSFTHTVYDFLSAIADTSCPRPDFEDGVQEPARARCHRAVGDRMGSGCRCSRCRLRSPSTTNANEGPTGEARLRTRMQRHWNRSSSLVFLAAIGAAAAAVLPATRASAEIRIGEREGWVLTTDGRINNFLSVTRGNWIPTGEPPYTGVDDAQTTGNQ